MLREPSLVPEGPFSQLKIGLVSDDITRMCLTAECQVRNVTPQNGLEILKTWKPDILLVESAWLGFRNSWRYRIAAYPDNPERTNQELRQLVAQARDLGVPTVFWNKEDGVHFERFIDSARLFEHIFTVDSGCIPRYRSIVDPSTSVECLMFAVQARFHHFAGIEPKISRANFVGSYNRTNHVQRRQLQEMLLRSANQSLGLTIYDRNSGRQSKIFRFPEQLNVEMKLAVPNWYTASVYRTYLASLNVNTILDSPTMFSRRILEIVASGGLAVTTSSQAMTDLFQPYCHIVESSAQATELFTRLKADGLNQRDREMMKAGADFAAASHTWTQRIEQICSAAL